MRVYFKNYRDVKTVLEYLESLGEYKDNETYLGRFVYLLVGYRKYEDTEFLNYFPLEKLSQMLYGIMLCDADCFDSMIWECEHSYSGFLDWKTIINIALNSDWKDKLKLEKENKNKLKIKELENELKRLKGEI